MIIEKSVIDLFVDSKEEIRRKKLYDNSETYCYMVAFPTTFDTNLARECRGLIIGESGKILRRPYHKFFNANEKEETLTTVLDDLEIETVHEKVDGSMIAPWIDSNNELNFDTKKLNLDMRTKLNALVPENIRVLSRKLLENGSQPIFECYHPDIPETNIVLEYNKPVWKLLDIRDLITGEYKTTEYVSNIAEESNISTPTRYKDLEKLKASEIVQIVKELESIEGVVIKYNDGTFTKVKCAWYLERHHILDVFNFEHKMAQMILNETIDDISAFMTPERLAKYNNFSNELHTGMSNIKRYVIDSAKLYSSKKEFGVSENSKLMFSNIIFRLIGNDYSDAEVFNLVKQHIIKLYINKTVQFTNLKECKPWVYK